MSKSSGRKIFVNLAVRDLKRAKGFFSALGLDFNPKFSDDNGACAALPFAWPDLPGSRVDRRFST